MRKSAWLLSLALTASLVGLVGSPASATHLGTTVLVDGSDTTPDAGGCGNVLNPCNTILAGVNHANPGDTVEVAAGTYGLVSTVPISKPLTLHGPNQANDPTGGGARVSEAVIEFAGASRGLRIRSGDVTIKGFSFEGFSNASGNTALWHNGADSVNGLTVENNIFDDNSQAFSTSVAAASNPNELMNFVFQSNLITNNAVRALSSYTGVRGSDFTISGNEFVGALVPIHLGFVERVAISQNSIQMTDPFYAILLADDIADISVMENVLDGNDAAHLGIFVWGKTNVLGPVSVVDNDIKDFLSYGIDIRQDGGETTDVSQWAVNENSIVGNDLLGVRNNGTGTLNATCNWWGAADGPGPVGPGSGDGVSTNVNYTPWETSENGPCEGFPPNPPPSKDACKKGGWEAYTDDENRPFKNQGDCVSYVATGGRNKADG